MSVVLPRQIPHLSIPNIENPPEKRPLSPAALLKAKAKEAVQCTLFQEKAISTTTAGHIADLALLQISTNKKNPLTGNLSIMTFKSFCCSINVALLILYLSHI